MNKSLNGYLSDAKSSNVLAVGGGAISSSPQRSHDTPDSLHSDPPVYGVIWRRRGTGQASAGVVVANGFHGRCQDACHHTQH